MRRGQMVKEVTFFSEPLHMNASVLADQQELIYFSFVQM